MTRFLRANLAAALAVVTVSVPAFAQDVEAQIKELNTVLRQQRQDLIDARIDTLQPVKVNGVEVSTDRFRREAIFLVGAKQLEGHIAQFLVEEQVEQAIADGRDPADFEIADEVVIEEVKGLVQQFQQENPGVEFWDAVRAQYGLDRESFLAQNKATKLFDKVFFPGPATEWPLITKEAIMASAQGGDGKQFWDNIEKASTDEEGNPRDLPPFWMQLCRGWVQKQLKSWSEILYPADGLPADVCLSVNGRTMATDKAFDQIKAGLYTQDLERAVTEVLIREALRQELEQAGVYLSDEDFRSQFNEYRSQYDNTVFNTEVIATAFKGYPSLEAFRERWRLMASFEKLIEKDINDDNLQEFANKRAAFFSDGRLSCDVIQFFGRDIKTGAWRNDGMKLAKAKADEAMAKLQDGADFDEIMNEYGEYYATDKERGRFGAKAMNQVRQAIRETEFTDLLVGYSVGVHLFFDAEVGTVVGPLRGPDAYFIARVNSRIPPASQPNVQDERVRELVRQDYVQQRFMSWANEVVGRTNFE